MLWNNIHQPIITNYTSTSNIFRFLDFLLPNQVMSKSCFYSMILFFISRYFYQQILLSIPTATDSVNAGTLACCRWRLIWRPSSTGEVHRVHSSDHKTSRHDHVGGCNGYNWDMIDPWLGLAMFCKKL